MDDLTNGHWFLNGRLSIALAQSDNSDRISILRHELPLNDAPPWHVHHDEDEIFQIVEGQLRFRLADKVFVRETGETVLLPRGIAHGFRVISPGGAHFLTITRGGFEQMVRTAWRPATSSGLPEKAEPTPEMQAPLAEACAANGIELLGPAID